MGQCQDVRASFDHICSICSRARALFCYFSFFLFTGSTWTIGYCVQACGTILHTLFLISTFHSSFFRSLHIDRNKKSTARVATETPMIYINGLLCLKCQPQQPKGEFHWRLGLIRVITHLDSSMPDPRPPTTSNWGRLQKTKRSIIVFYLVWPLVANIGV